MSAVQYSGHFLGILSSSIEQSWRKLVRIGEDIWRDIKSEKWVYLTGAAIKTVRNKLNLLDNSNIGR